MTHGLCLSEAMSSAPETTGRGGGFPAPRSLWVGREPRHHLSHLPHLADKKGNLVVGTGTQPAGCRSRICTCLDFCGSLWAAADPHPWAFQPQRPHSCLGLQVLNTLSSGSRGFLVGQLLTPLEEHPWNLVSKKGQNDLLELVFPRTLGSINNIKLCLLFS